MKSLFLSVALMLTSALSAQTKLWTLQECVDYAMQNNITLQKARLQQQSAKEDVSQSKAALLPSLNASTSHNFAYRPWQSSGITTVTNGTVNTKVEKTSYNGSYGLNASWTVWNGNRNRNQVKLNKLSEERADLEIQETANSIQEKIARTSLGYMTQKLLEARYMEFKSRDDLTGGAKLDIGKICSMASFFAQKCHGGLFKVKLMKLLWYADAVFYREYGHAMSGLVYQHKPLGALPVGHYELMGVIPHEEVYDNFEETSYRILPMESYDESCFTKDELNVLNKVIVSFQAFTGKEMAECMHKEDAYVLTADQAYIPYSLAKHVTI